MQDASPLDGREVVCPHCRRRFDGRLIEGGASRYVGFKCPFCKLFVPLDRVDEQPAPATSGRPRAAD